MSIKLNRDVDYFRITCNESEIVANWNYFTEFVQAENYLKSGMTLLPNSTYGIVKVRKTLWDYIPN